ncbi:MAG: two-component system, OmpR family, sensor kinase [Solirubrobacteraceae bacterium]|jgi:signal transduction histidine kinase|nr:two-component system, OmpR family, sensor kinase [Solirubrobacteraceae bacterium]
MGLRSLRTRLTLLFFAITLVAVGVVFFYVAPQLESSLTEQKLSSLARTARARTPQIKSVVLNNGTARQVDQRVAQIGDTTSTRVTLLIVGTGTLGPQLAIVSDSTTEVQIDGLRFDIASVAERTGREARGSEYRGKVLLGQVAEPIRDEGVVSRVAVFSSPLSDVQDNVALIRRQILVAGALGLLLSLAGGSIVSRTIAHRVKELEQGAERVAGGDFTAVFPAHRDDELGQLARALDDMQRQLAEVETARRRFIATASHELRTPIFSLGGFLELLEDEDLDDATRREFVAVVREQVARLGKLATDLLDLSKLEAGSLELRPEATDLGDLAGRVTAEFAPALDKHASRLDLRVGGDRVEAVCDPERVAQILRILIDNALIHTPAGTGVVVTAARANGAVRLGVCDDGPGIRDGTASRVFEPFFTSDDAQGSGLGLAIARELAERMRGSLDVDTAPGRTMFSLELPA